jgi:hypothetical protein
MHRFRPSGLRIFRKYSGFLPENSCYNPRNCPPFPRIFDSTGCPSRQSTESPPDFPSRICIPCDLQKREVRSIPKGECPFFRTEPVSCQRFQSDLRTEAIYGIGSHEGETGKFPGFPQTAARLPGVVDLGIFTILGRPPGFRVAAGNYGTVLCVGDIAVTGGRGGHFPTISTTSSQRQYQYSTQNTKQQTFS